MLLVTDYKITAKHNNSLDSWAGVKLFVAMALLTLLVAIAFSVMGAWVVMPFAGLELLAFAFAFYYVYARANEYESIKFDGDKLVIEKNLHQSLSVVEFSRHWVQVRLQNVVNGKQGLFISSHGKEVEFGQRFLTDEQRKQLVQEIKSRLKKI